MMGTVECRSREGGGVRIGVIDTGVNPWHSHVRGGVYGCRIFLDGEGAIREDGEIRDAVGHGTAVAAILRQYVPEAEIFAVRVFERDLGTYPSLVARAVLRAAAEGCRLLNLSLAMAPGPGMEQLAEACAEAIAAGCLIVAAGHPGKPGLLPASLPGVLGVVGDDTLPEGEIRFSPGDEYPYSAAGRPRELAGVGGSDNLWGNSFACARVTAHLAANLGVKPTSTG